MIYGLCVMSVAESIANNIHLELDDRYSKDDGPEDILKHLECDGRSGEVMVKNV